MDAVESSKTHRLYLLLKERIQTGVLAPGDRLPGEPSLAATHGLSRVTVRRALDGLSRDGLVTRLPGAGTFVTEPNGRPPVVADLANMFAHLVAMGRASKVRLLSFAYVVPPPAIAAALGLAPGERTQASLRVRSFDDVPFSYLATHVPERIGVTYSEGDLANRPLLELLERSGVVADRAEQTISATLAGPDAAAALGVEIGSALIALTRVVRDGEGRGIEHLSALYRPDQHAFRMELVRAGDGEDRHWRPTTRLKVPAAHPNATGSEVNERPKTRQRRKP